MKHTLTLLLLFVCSLKVMAQDEQGHPLFNTMPNFAEDKYAKKHKDFESLSIYEPDKTSSAGYKVVSKEGELDERGFRYKDENNKPSNLQILTNFKNAVLQKGGSVVYSDDFYKDKIFLKLKKGSDTYWIKVYVDGIGGYWISSIREAAMKQDIVVSAAEIKSALSSEGRVAFYGIYFDVDKALVKPESDAALKEIAAYLKANSAAVYVVGHTDNSGDFARNMTLSKDRAAAVVAELSTKYGVSKTQLNAQGVASLSPVAPNKTEEGKAKNRRVEIVLK